MIIAKNFVLYSFRATRLRRTLLCRMDTCENIIPLGLSDFIITQLPHIEVGQYHDDDRKDMLRRKCTACTSSYISSQFPGGGCVHFTSVLGSYMYVSELLTQHACDRTMLLASTFFRQPSNTGRLSGSQDVDAVHLTRRQLWLLFMTVAVHLRRSSHTNSTCRGRGIVTKCASRGPTMYGLLWMCGQVSPTGTKTGPTCTFMANFGDNPFEQLAR